VSEVEIWEVFTGALRIPERRAPPRDATPDGIHKEAHTI
jgi:hypothetical protein